jgi:hypothetical protein
VKKELTKGSLISSVDEVYVNARRGHEGILDMDLGSLRDGDGVGEVLSTVSEGVCNSWRAGGQQEGLQYNGEAA